MTRVRVLCVAILMTISSLAFAQGSMKPGDKAWMELEETLRDANQQWLCQGKHYKPKRQACVDFRAKYWADQFFEINPGSPTQTKAQMLAGQNASAKTFPDILPGEGANPTEFKLMAVYDNFAVGVDHTLFKIHLNAKGEPDFEHSIFNYRTDHWYLDESGKLAVIREVTYARLFVKENGMWKPAAGVSVPHPWSK